MIVERRVLSGMSVPCEMIGPEHMLMCLMASRLVFVKTKLRESFIFVLERGVTKY